jgi:hypothetical protein
MSGVAGRLLRIGVVVVPVTLIILLFHFVGPTLQTEHRLRTLPAGYESPGRYGPIVLFARPDNQAARAAAAILARFLTAVEDEYADAFHLRPVTDRMELVVFSNQEDLERFGRSALGSDFQYNGGFYLADGRTIGVVGDGNPRQLVRPLFHEGTHLILDSWVEGGGHEWSRWFDEGLASYFQASRIRSDRIRLGGVSETSILEARQALREGRWPSLSDLFDAPSDVWTGPDNWLYYSKASLLVEYLADGEGGALRSRFLDWFENERRPGPVGAWDFSRIVGDPASIDAALVRHVRAL